MGRNNYFQFKQFRIEQEKSAMKVGVDGVLLGAWAAVSNSCRILDVGTGTGLIALMLGQRSEAQITAIEIEKNAASEALKNVSNSPWTNRIEVLHTSFQQFAMAGSPGFDLIVSNPPFFTQASKAANSERTLARHNDSLSFEDLIHYSVQLLNEAGSLAVIVPNSSFEKMNQLAQANQLHVKRLTKVRPKPEKNVNRVLVQWSKLELLPQVTELTIYKSDGSFTQQYMELTRDFYLKF